MNTKVGDKVYLQVQKGVLVCPFHGSHNARLLDNGFPKNVKAHLIVESVDALAEASLVGVTQVGCIKYKMPLFIEQRAWETLIVIVPLRLLRLR